jgi:hypothetical protein
MVNGKPEQEPDEGVTLKYTFFTPVVLFKTLPVMVVPDPFAGGVNPGSVVTVHENVLITPLPAGTSTLSCGSIVNVASEHTAPAEDALPTGRELMIIL